MRRAVPVFTLALLGLLVPESRAGSVEIRGGGFLPRAESSLFDDDSELYQRDGRALERSDWNGATGGIQFNAGLARNVEIGFSLDVYERTLHTSYRDFVRDNGREIQQSLKLDIVPVGVSLRLGPTGRHVRIAPFVEAGGDLFFYKYEEFGEFVDFDSPSLPIVEDSFISEGVAPGFHVGGGIRFGLTDDLSLTGQFRYQVAKDDMGDDFRGNEIDLTGSSATLGLHLRF